MHTHIIDWDTQYNILYTVIAFCIHNIFIRGENYVTELHTRFSRDLISPAAFRFFAFGLYTKILSHFICQG